MLEASKQNNNSLMLQTSTTVENHCQGENDNFITKNVQVKMTKRQFYCQKCPGKDDTIIENRLK